MNHGTTSPWDPLEYFRASCDLAKPSNATVAHRSPPVRTGTEAWRAGSIGRAGDPGRVSGQPVGRFGRGDPRDAPGDRRPPGRRPAIAGACSSAIRAGRGRAASTLLKRGPRGARPTGRTIGGAGSWFMW